MAGSMQLSLYAALLTVPFPMKTCELYNLKRCPHTLPVSLDVQWSSQVSTNVWQYNV